MTVVSTAPDARPHLKTASHLFRPVYCLSVVLAGTFIALAPASFAPAVRVAAGATAITAALVLSPSVAEARRFGGGRSFGGFGRMRSFGARSFSRRGLGRGYSRGFAGRRGLGGFGLGMGLGMLGGWGFGGLGLFGLGRMLLFPLILFFILRMMSRR